MFSDTESNLNRQQMQKIVFVLMLITFFLVGCGNTSSTTVTDAPQVTEPPTTELPATEAPATEPPATESPATEPPATEPIVHNDPLGIGDSAPDFTLLDSNGDMLNLADLLQDNRLVLLVFYHAYT